VREVLLENGWAHEAMVSLSDLESADEVFVTSSTRGVHPVVKCGDREFERIGQVTKNVIDAFDSLPK
jgi:branched-subunit amino acid aminotransferase/4-amino-4-deoxychorismate lyase